MNDSLFNLTLESHSILLGMLIGFFTYILIEC